MSEEKKEEAEELNETFTIVRGNVKQRVKERLKERLTSEHLRSKIERSVKGGGDSGAPEAGEWKGPVRLKENYYVGKDSLIRKQRIQRKTREEDNQQETTL